MTSYQNKKVAILGWGIDTRDCVPWLLEQGAKITVFDKKKVAENGEEFSGITWELGKEDFGDLTKFETVIRSPGVYRYRKEIIEAEKAGVEISSKTKLFFDLCPGQIIGVTGTKGKGTTATLIYQMLKAGSKEAYLGGNIGEKVFDFLPRLNKNSWVVLELSSFQLIDLSKSPHIAVVLMVTSEHQDWHPTVEEYVNAKKNIVSHQQKDDFSVVNRDYPHCRDIADAATGKVIWVSGGDLKDFASGDIGLRGEHNRENVAAAATAAKLAGVPEPIIRKVIKTFKGLEHRLEEVAVIDGVTYFNDSFSTVPETTIAAIKSFREPLILIAGGSEKGSDFTHLGKEIIKAKNIRAVILIGLMAKRITKAVRQAENEQKKGKSVKIVTGCRNMGEIITTARKLASRGDIILLSPAAASFDMFQNYKDRGNQFKKAVLDLNHIYE